MKAKINNLHKTGNVKGGMITEMLFKTFRGILGGRVRLMVTGSAPVAEDILDFMKCAMSVPIVEGYGQTETTAASFLTSPKDGKSGHVGGPTM